MNLINKVLLLLIAQFQISNLEVHPSSGWYHKLSLSSFAFKMYFIFPRNGLYCIKEKRDDLIKAQELKLENFELRIYGLKFGSMADVNLWSSVLPGQDLVKMSRINNLLPYIS